MIKSENLLVSKYLQELFFIRNIMYEAKLLIINNKYIAHYPKAFIQ